MRSELKIGRWLGLALMIVVIGCSSFATLRQAQADLALAKSQAEQASAALARIQTVGVKAAMSEL